MQRVVVEQLPLELIDCFTGLSCDLVQVNPDEKGAGAVVTLNRSHEASKKSSADRPKSGPTLIWLSASSQITRIDCHAPACRFIRPERSKRASRVDSLLEAPITIEGAKLEHQRLVNAAKYANAVVSSGSWIKSRKVGVTIPARAQIVPSDSAQVCLSEESRRPELIANTKAFSASCGSLDSVNCIAASSLHASLGEESSTSSKCVVD